MKTTRKILAMVLAVIMVMSLATTAFAAKNDSITINSAKAGETYNLYKLFDLKVDDEEDPKAYTYTVNADWAAFFNNGEGKNYITVNEAGAVTAISDSAALAKKAAEWTGKPGAAQSIKAASTSVTFNDLTDGYWLVTSTLGTIAMAETTPDKAAVTITEKNPENTISKTVNEDGKYGAANDAQVGATVEFKSVVKLVKGTRNVVVHDKMDSGLTYNAGSVTISGLTKGTDYSVNESPTDGDTFDITFTQSWIDGLDFGTDGYKEYEITYTAVLNQNAVVKDASGVAIVDQNNKTHVSFGDATSSTEATTTTTTHKFAVFKHATGSSDNLAGAVFKLKKDGVAVTLVKLDDNNYRVAKTGETGVASFTTVAKGDIVIWGVDTDGAYTLEETAAPEGYNMLTAEVAVTVNADNTYRADVENKAGSTLPETGGVGTTMFYIFGSVMVLAAVVLLVTKKRMASAE